MKIFSTSDMPESNGHYSQCIEHNGILYLSGQLPIRTADQSIPVTIEEQTDLVLQNVATILKGAGSDKNKVIQVRVYIPEIELWDKVNERYSLFFKNHKPARCIIPTGKLHYGCLVEIEVTAISKR